jgi:hypothetical protein
MENKAIDIALLTADVSDTESDNNGFAALHSFDKTLDGRRIPRLNKI